MYALHKLRSQGLSVRVFEAAPDVGGTWLENAYPGCRVDVANHFYSYSFAPNHDWPEFFSQRDELRAYFQRCATEFGARPLRRTIQRRVENELSRLVLSGGVQPGDKIVVSVAGDDLHLDVETGGAAELLDAEEERQEETAGAPA